MKKLGCITYLLLFLGFIGVIVDVVIYYKTKDKRTKFYAGQAALLWLSIYIIMIFGFALVFPYVALFSGYHTPDLQILMILTYIASALYIILAILALFEKKFRLPIIDYFLED